MIKTLAKQYLENPDTIPSEYIATGYEFVAKYCSENNLSLPDFVSDKENSQTISESIHKALPWLYRKAIPMSEIADIINQNHDWISAKFSEIHACKKKPSI